MKNRKCARLCKKAAPNFVHFVECGGGNVIMKSRGFARLVYRLMMPSFYQNKILLSAVLGSIYS